MQRGIYLFDTFHYTVYCQRRVKCIRTSTERKGANACRFGKDVETDFRIHVIHKERCDPSWTSGILSQYREKFKSPDHSYGKHRISLSSYLIKIPETQSTSTSTAAILAAADNQPYFYLPFNIFSPWCTKLRKTFKCARYFSRLICSSFSANVNIYIKKQKNKNNNNTNKRKKIENRKR